jgi:streptomycin 6-kinase
MSFFVPTRLRESVARRGVEAALWLDCLPARVAELEQAWSLTTGRAFDIDGEVSWVAPARLEDGSEAVLKVGIPYRSTRREADALRFWDGGGAVRLLRVSEDGYSLLLERCVPGTNLWSLGEEEGNVVGAELLRRLWREPPPAAPFPRVADLVEEWCEALPRTAPAQGYDAALVSEAMELARELAATQPRTVLLHGNFHPGNVLAAEREPWLAIDCQPLVGEPAFDLAQWLGNRDWAAERSPDPMAALRWQIDQMCGVLALDPARVIRWAFAKSVGEEFGPSTARLFHAAMDA